MSCSSAAGRSDQSGIRVGGFGDRLPGQGRGGVGGIPVQRHRSFPLRLRPHRDRGKIGPAMTNARDLTDEEIIDALRRAAATWWRNDDIVLLEELVRRFRRLRETHPTLRAE